MASILYDEVGITYDSILGPTGSPLNYDGDTDISQRTVVWGKRRAKGKDQVATKDKHHSPTPLTPVLVPTHLAKHKQEDIALAIALLCT